MNEIWKDIDCFEGLYQVSNMGRVKSLNRTLMRKNGSPYIVKERILIPQVDTRGYFVVSLAFKKDKTLALIHRLVAKAFIPNPGNKPQIDHIDGNRQNNFSDNLRWVTSHENHINPVTVKRRLESNCPIGKGLNAVPVIGISQSDNSIIRFKKIKDVKEFGFDPSSVSKCILGKRKFHKGYLWSTDPSKQ